MYGVTEIGYSVMIVTFWHKGLRELFQTGHGAKVPANLAQRCLDILQALDAATSLKDLNLPGFQLHELHTRPIRHSIHVNGPWTITFEWDAPNAYRVDLEQYH
jgi:toxin HigB-1